jgi:hypothetical protein
MQSGSHLPPFMRDFHDQKRLFKRLDEIVQRQPKDGSALREMPNWVVAQIYVIDFFLWFMARRGYTLQKARTTQPFIDLAADLADFDRRQMEQFKRDLEETQKPKVAA